MNFDQIWRERFGTCPPFGWVFSHRQYYVWTRFHALPKSKRYAETDAEMSTILERANTLGDRLFGDDPYVWLTSARAFLIDEDKWADDQPSVTRQSYDLDHVSEWSWPDNNADPNTRFEVKAGRITWNNSKFNQLFSAVADDKEYGMGFISHDMNNALYPYDGGFDVLIHDKSLKMSLREEFADWLPQNEYGL